MSVGHSTLPILVARKVLSFPIVLAAEVKGAPPTDITSPTESHDSDSALSPQTASVATLQTTNMLSPNAHSPLMSDTSGNLSLASFPALFAQAPNSTKQAPPSISTQNTEHAEATTKAPSTFKRVHSLIKHALAIPVFASALLGIFGMFISFGTAAAAPIALSGVIVIAVFLLLSTLPETISDCYALKNAHLSRLPLKEIFWLILKPVCTVLCAVTLGLAIYVGFAQYFAIVISVPILWSVFGVGAFHSIMIMLFDIRIIYNSFKDDPLKDKETWRQKLKKSWPSLMCASVGLVGGLAGCVMGGIQGAPFVKEGFDEIVEGVGSISVFVNYVSYYARYSYLKRQAADSDTTPPITPQSTRCFI